MYATRVTGPSGEPLGVETAKAHLRVEVDEDDALIQGLIATARERAEAATGRALLTQTWQLRLPQFPADGRIRLPKSPLQAVTAITYLDGDEVEQTLPADQYRVHAPSGPFPPLGWVTRPWDVAWPAATLADDAVRVTFTAGYGTNGEAVPQTLREAMLLMVGHWYEHRETVAFGFTGASNLSELPLGASALLHPYVVMGAP